MKYLLIILIGVFVGCNSCKDIFEPTSNVNITGEAITHTSETTLNTKPVYIRTFIPTVVDTAKIVSQYIRSGGSYVKVTPVPGGNIVETEIEGNSSVVKDSTAINNHTSVTEIKVPVEVEVPITPGWAWKLLIGNIIVAILGILWLLWKFKIFVV